MTEAAEEHGGARYPTSSLLWHDRQRHQLRPADRSTEVWDAIYIQPRLWSPETGHHCKLSETWRHQISESPHCLKPPVLPGSSHGDLVSQYDAVWEQTFTPSLHGPHRHPAPPTSSLTRIIRNIVCQRWQRSRSSLKPSELARPHRRMGTQASPGRRKPDLFQAQGPTILCDYSPDHLQIKAVLIRKIFWNNFTRRAYHPDLYDDQLPGCGSSGI